MTNDDQYALGREMIATIFGEFQHEIRAGFEDVAPDFFRYADTYVFGELWRRDVLPLRERILTVIGALTVLGLDFTLGHWVRAALVHGIRKEEIVEAIMTVAPYGGHPRAIGGFRVCKEAFTEWDRRHPQAS